MPLLHGKPGGGGELDVGHDADADDRDVARELSTVDGLDGRHAGRAVQRLDCRAAVNHHARGTMRGFVECGDLDADGARHDALGSLEHGDVEAALPDDGRDFQADVPRADQQHPRSRGERRGDAIDIGDRAQVMHTG